VTATSENLVLLDQGQATSRWNQPLQLYYPPTNILSDHPFAILQGDWVTAEEQQAAAMFRDFLLDVPQQQLALASGFRPTNPNVHINDKVPQNLFKNQPFSINLSQQIDTLTLAQAPRGDVLNALLDLWSKTYGTSPLATSPENSPWALV
jgi:ABC-type sulfate transport system substrate-binding protein